MVVAEVREGDIVGEGRFLAVPMDEWLGEWI
jgi:hypothetical protein